MQTRENDHKGHIPAILQDEIAQLPLVDLTPTAVRGFRDRLAEKYSAATVVKRLNLLAAICQHAIAEWDLPFSKNPATATAVKRPVDADKKRNLKGMLACDSKLSAIRYKRYALLSLSR
ncbi:MAG: hypothetical protein ABF876_07600 [Acetobacter aceti]|uniref:hypothetical protein n=1 Tax=Acetobacter aceti TaxID=435 RepID=UPI001F2EC3CD|nr:hypothetical protein [Acetobacter aceti]